MMEANNPKASGAEGLGYEVRGVLGGVLVYGMIFMSEGYGEEFYLAHLWRR